MAPAAALSSEMKRDSTERRFSAAKHGDLLAVVAVRREYGL
jgi:hypothetical protein